jgi:type II pantothenate kinase
MPVFPLLSDPTNYVACDWNLTADRAGLEYWIDHFGQHADTLAPLIRDVYHPTEAKLADYLANYLAELDRVRTNPAAYGRVTILSLDRIRDEHLRAAGFDDPYRHIKQKENAAALTIYPRMIAELDAQPDDVRLAELITGIFAGNIFDLGAMATVKKYHGGGMEVFSTRSSLAPRPWLIDNFDEMLRHWSAANWRYRKVVLLADNAGCDFVLGCLPLVREFAGRRAFSGTPLPLGEGPKRPRSGAGEGFGEPTTQVVIAVNTGPSLNDILPDEVAFVLNEASKVDPVLAKTIAAGRITVVPTGNTAPLIDLSEVSDELAAVSADADLLILEGMGRSVESNLAARFKVDSARMALVKDQGVANRLAGKLFDICCKFKPAER